MPFALLHSVCPNLLRPLPGACPSLFSTLETMEDALQYPLTFHISSLLPGIQPDYPDYETHFLRHVLGTQWEPNKNRLNILDKKKNNKKTQKQY